jgi:hypothetical protein
LQAAVQAAAGNAVHAVPAPRTTRQWDEVIAQIEARQQQAQAAVAVLEEERKPHALPAVMGDAQAISVLADMDRRRQDLRNELDTLRDALVSAQTQRAAAAEVEAAERRAAQLVEAKAIAAEVMAVAAELDSRMVGLAEAFGRERELLVRLERTRVPLPSLRRIARSPTRTLAALHCAGLGEFFPLDRVAPSFHRSRASWMDDALHNLLDPARTRPANTATVIPPSPELPSGAESAIQTVYVNREADELLRAEIAAENAARHAVRAEHDAEAGRHAAEERRLHEKVLARRAGRSTSRRGESELDPTVAVADDVTDVDVHAFEATAGDVIL